MKKLGIAAITFIVVGVALGALFGALAGVAWITGRTVAFLLICMVVTTVILRESRWMSE